MRSVMKIIYCFILSLGITGAAYAKCWSSREINPVFCAKLRFIEKVKTTETCIFRLAILKYSVPAREFQNKSAVQTFEKAKEIFVKFEDSLCTKVDSSRDLDGMVEGVCNDKGSDAAYSYVYQARKSSFPRIGNSQKKIKIECK